MYKIQTGNFHLQNPSTIGNSSYRLNFDLGKKDEIYIIIAQKSILKLVKLQSLVAKCCKMRKIYSPVKFENFVYNYLHYTRGKNNQF
jgi:hypothetical protein